MPQVDLEAIADEGKTKAARAVEYVRTIQVDPPKFSLLTGLIFCVIWMVITFGYGWYKAHERDKWWRAEIASKSVAVKIAITKANAELPDDEILRTLGDTDEALRKAEQAVRTSAPIVSNLCPVIPAGCLR